MSKLSELRERVEGASGPSRELDGEIDAALFGGRAAHTFNENTSGARLRKSYGAGTVFDHTDPQTNGGYVLSTMHREAEPLTSSIDAALALVERMLPGAEYEITTLYGVAAVTIFTPFTAYGRREDGDVRLAILCALLRALEAKDTGRG